MLHPLETGEYSPAQLNNLLLYWGSLSLANPAAIINDCTSDSLTFLMDRGVNTKDDKLDWSFIKKSQIIGL